jgi:Leucine-rich repeat (LRR) protein
MRLWRRRLLLAASAVTLALLLFVLWLRFFAAPADPAGPPDEVWCQKVRKFPVRERVRIVLAKLEELNPGFRRAPGDYTAPEVLELELSTDHLSDIRPLTALVDLKVLSLTGSKKGAGKLADLTPLKGMKLIRLTLARNPDLTDLAPLRKMPLYKLELTETGVASLEELTESSLMHLNIAGTSVKDLGPVRMMSKLQFLDCKGCPIDSLEPLTGTPLKELYCDFRPIRDTKILKSIATLQSINEVPVKLFWKQQAE